MISKTDERILSMMLEKCDRLCEICNSHTDEEIEENYLFIKKAAECSLFS